MSGSEDVTIEEPIVRLGGRRRVMFATAELSPLCRVGGLADASAGLVAALRRHGADVDVVVPDHWGSPGLVVEHTETLDVPHWAGPAVARYGTLDGVGRVIAIRSAATSDIHPYNDPASGRAWDDNDLRYLSFSAAVAALAMRRRPDVVHLNDWHTAAAAAWLPERLPIVLTIHNLAYQGQCSVRWVELMGSRGPAFARGDSCNPLAGGIAIADRVVAVSPTYAGETRRPGHGDGLDDLLRDRGPLYSGIRNGIDVSLWDPSIDRHLPAAFSWDDLEGKGACRAELLRRAGLPDMPDEPVVGMVCRFVDQKGIDTALSVASQLRGLPARLVLMGRGEPELEAAAVAAWVAEPLRIAYLRESSEELAHLVIAGSDLLLVPSRFEPCGLTPMEAMRCGTIPVVTPVGGLRDSVIDASGNETHGNGFIAPAADSVGVSLALSRAIRAWANPERRAAIRRSGMTADWSWWTPAQAYLDLYDEVCPTASASLADATAVTSSMISAGALDGAPASYGG